MKEFFINYIWQFIQNTLGIIYKDYLKDNIITRVDYSATD